MKYRVLLSSILLAVQIVYGQEIVRNRSEWTYNDHWENTQIEFEKLIFGTINQATCTKNIKEFMGCMGVLNKTYEMMYPAKNYLVKYSPENNFEKIAPFAIEEYATLSKEDFFLIKKKYFRDIYSQYKSMGQGLVQFNFNATVILQSFSQQIVTSANDQMTAGLLYNEYLALVYDPHTYIQPTSYLQDRSQPTDRRKGMGIFYHIDRLNNEEVIMLQEIIPNSPAERSGLLAGDIILKANSADKLEGIQKVISSEENITFEIYRDEKNLQIQLTKDFYEVTQVQSSIIERDGLKYGYIKLRSFSDKTACTRITEVGTKMVQEDRIDGVVLDLRNNGGGLVSQMQCIAQLYLETGSRTWAVKYLGAEDSELVEQKARKTNNIFGNIHTVTLINSNSASASEALSMYLKDYRKSFIVGERSFGKGSMQGVGPTNENPLISQGKTMALYYGPKGISPQVVGVEPDFVSFPKFGQTKATPAIREADEYLFVLENEVNQQELIEADRLEEVSSIDQCMAERKKVKDRFQSTGPSKKKIFDNQLETGIEVIACANQYVSIYKSTEIPLAPGVSFISEFEFQNRQLQRQRRRLGTPTIPIKQDPPRILPRKNPNP